MDARLGVEPPLFVRARSREISEGTMSAHEQRSS